MDAALEGAVEVAALAVLLAERPIAELDPGPQRLGDLSQPEQRLGPLGAGAGCLLAPLEQLAAADLVAGGDGERARGQGSAMSGVAARRREGERILGELGRDVGRAPGGGAGRCPIEGRGDGLVGLDGAEREVAGLGLRVVRDLGEPTMEPAQLGRRRGGVHGRSEERMTEPDDCAVDLDEPGPLRPLKLAWHMGDGQQVECPAQLVEGRRRHRGDAQQHPTGPRREPLEAPAQQVVQPVRDRQRSARHDAAGALDEGSR